MSIAFYSASDPSGQLLTELGQRLPNQQFVVWPNIDDPAAVTLAIVWLPPVDFFAGMNSLTHVLSIAAGVDQLLLHPGLPTTVDIIRLEDAGMGELMAEYVLYGVLHAHRSMPQLRAAQRQSRWAREISSSSAQEFSVGILGAGAMGLVVADRLQLNAYDVACWSRSPKTHTSIKHYAGLNHLPAFLESLNVLVCLLPLTDKTRGFLNADVFAALPKGAYVINVGRGEHLNEQDLLDALNQEQLSGALLDVFATEPLPENHPFWSHRAITVTPHLAAPSPLVESAQQIATNIQLILQGKPPFGLVDRQRGY